MGYEKQSSKGGGGYVGGFLQLFDWNAKSRKKLFSNKFDLPEQSEQKKRSDGILPMTCLHLNYEDEIISGSRIKGSSDCSCASSVTDEDACGSRAPGVVAKLMGLDSLPTSNCTEPYSTPLFDSKSLRDTYSHRTNSEFDPNYQLMRSGGRQYKKGLSAKNIVDPNPPKIISKPFEKFQTETLPPKSAKTIPITHHKLLSPIKGPGFIPSKNAAHIMEAAARIISPGPRVSNKARMSLLGSSSVPLKVRDLKEKVEATQKPSRLTESSQTPMDLKAAKYLKRQSLDKSWSGSFLFYSDSDESSAGTQNGGRSISLALQAKANVQKREGLSNASSNRSLYSRKEQYEVSSHNASGALRQNNQKQNGSVDRGRIPSKSLVSNSHVRRPLSRDSLSERQKSSKISSGKAKVGSRKLSSEAADCKREISGSAVKNTPRKKRTIDRNIQFDRNQIVDSTLTDENGKTMSNSLTDNQYSWADDRKRKGSDVVSFTFTAPLAQQIHGPSESSREVLEKTNYLSADYLCRNDLRNLDSTSSKLSLRYNVIQGDALSTLLDQKLRELTLAAESSRHKVAMAGRPSIFQDILPMPHDDRVQYDMNTNKMASQLHTSFSSADPLGLIRKYKHQEGEEISNCCGNDTVGMRKSFCYQHPSPISVLEPSLFTERSISSDTAESYSMDGSKQCSSVQGQEVPGTISSKKICSIEADTELFDSASSTNARNVTGKHMTTFSSSSEYAASSSSEQDYVKEILCNIELMFNDFVLGWSRRIINPRIFDQLESHKEVLGGHGAEAKLRRKLLFDCVTECLDIRCRRYVGGGSQAWAKGLSALRRKDFLAGEVYKEIQRWRSMGNCMVDELVEGDMSSSQPGKWLDFEAEAFELGREMEDRILNSLLDEVVADLLPL